MPSYPDWKIQDKDTVAHYLPESDFKGLLQKRIAVPPDQLAILIRDGEVALAEQGAHIAVGGIWQALKSFIGGRHALRMLVADLKPFPVTSTFTGITQDHTTVSGEVVIEFQLDATKPTSIMGLVSGGESLTRSDISERMRPHLEGRDLAPQLASHDVTELRTNVGLQDSLQAHIMETVERIAGDMGLQVRAVSVHWGLTEEERAQIAERQLKREDERLEADHKRQIRAFERSGDITTFQMKADVGIEKFKISSDAELEQMLLGNTIQLEDTRSTEARRIQMTETGHCIEVARQKRKAHHEEQLANTQNALERKNIELAISLLEAEAKTEQRRVDLALSEEEDLSGLRIADKAWEGQRGKLTDLQELELDKSKRIREMNRDEFQLEQDAKMAELRLKSEMELETLKQKGSMTEDQLLALQAGAAPEVAKIFAERAKASSGADKETLLREMIEMQQANKDSGDERLGKIVDKALDSMAVAASGKKNTTDSDSASDASKVECSQCHHMVLQGDRFCKTCGSQMRT
jgi:hypothetical protein